MLFFHILLKPVHAAATKYVIVPIQLRSVQAAAKKLLFFSGICTSCC